METVRGPGIIAGLSWRLVCEGTPQVRVVASESTKSTTHQVSTGI